MTGKAGNRLSTVLTVTCLVEAIIRIIAGRLGCAYTVDHGRNIIVTANAPLLLAGHQFTAIINAGYRSAGYTVCLGTDSRMINTVKGAERTVTGIAFRGVGKVIAVQEIATGSHATGNVTGSVAGYLRTKGVKQVGPM